MARMSIEEKCAIVRRLHNVHTRDDLGDDEEAIIQLQHDVEELLSTVALLLNDSSPSKTRTLRT